MKINNDVTTLSLIMTTIVVMEKLSRQALPKLIDGEAINIPSKYMRLIKEMGKITMYDMEEKEDFDPGAEEYMALRKLLDV